MNREDLTSQAPLKLKFARMIIRGRYIFFVLFALAAVYCALSAGRVKVNSDLSYFLPEDSETRRAVSVMNEEFVTYGSLRVMLNGVTEQETKAAEKMLENVTHVSFVSSQRKDASDFPGEALLTLSFDLPDGSKELSSVKEEVRSALSSYDAVYPSSLSGYSAQLAQEMVWVLLLSAVVIVAVLLYTSRSFFEVVIYFIVFFFAALLNMGTNHFFGEISSITNSVAIILQLALAIDYAIIFAHRYQEECLKTDDPKQAVTGALAQSLVEISSSSLTTIAGLAALTLMQFRLGWDLGVVLAKGILCSMLTVFLLMPGLILLFPRLLKKTAHRSFVPKIDRFARFVTGRRAAFLLIFALILPLAVVFSSKVDYAFNDRSVTQIIPSETRVASDRIDAEFGRSNTAAVILPRDGGYEKQKALISDLRSVDGISSVTGLAGVELSPGLFLCDPVSPGRAAQLLSADEQQVRFLFLAYALYAGASPEEYGDLSAYEAPLLDLALFLFDKIDEGALTPDQEQMKTLAPLREKLENAARQLHGKTKDRIALTVTLPADSAEGAELLETVREKAERYYEKGCVLIAGDLTVARDLRSSYKSDSLLISILTVVFIFIILLFTFRSFAAAAILVFVIQGSIFINFAFTFIFSMRPSFVTQMIVTAIQMGATIDYAIVLTSKYLSFRKTLDRRAAAARALSESFSTVLTSGAIMTFAGLIIAFRVSDVYVGHIGLAVGRGAFISALLVLTVLPQMLILCDKLIMKTTVRLHKKTHENRKMEERS